jgi:hypothetical protein
MTKYKHNLTCYISHTISYGIYTIYQWYDFPLPYILAGFKPGSTALHADAMTTSSRRQG